MTSKTVTVEQLRAMSPLKWKQVLAVPIIFEWDMCINRENIVIEAQGFDDYLQLKPDEHVFCGRYADT